MTLKTTAKSPLRRVIIYLTIIGTLGGSALAVAAESADGTVLVEKAFDYWRGQTSAAAFEMLIHRPDFERKMFMRGWTRGRQDALFYIEKPAKDKGNGTLKKGRQMWSYNPKINRVVKLPPSMMSQAWMGSDFSNDDLAKSDSLLDDYRHRIIATRTEDGYQVYDIESIPHEDAPVVWGKQALRIREDGILLRQAFFDEGMLLVKELLSSSIEALGGRLFPRVWIMQRADEEGHYTRMEYQSLTFDLELKPNLFTLTSLKSRTR
jgi:outer membrane lipoprotein-sorting protein